MARSSRKPLLSVTIILLCARARDLDNDIGGCKEARDAIAAWCGLDDAETVIEWDYGQVRTRGKQGMIVRVEVL